jgi:hypothetical protein
MNVEARNGARMKCIKSRAKASPSLDKVRMRAHKSCKVAIPRIATLQDKNDEVRYANFIRIGSKI